ncbi:universal stress protein [Chromobacterium sp. Beijing]|uniref:universal stress protein n=1 Tax=Chromobacterium sp. Beijing TaxID=2735795 RepID=UPI002102CD47|nr:universal stress protein [Chromobacterium sp. Beijing]
MTADCKILESWGDKIAAVLVDDAGVWGADLIVMGTHGWSGLMHLLMGSVAEGVLKLADVPVLLVRNPGD